MNFNVKFQTHNQDMNPSFAQMVEHVKKGKDGATFTPDVSPEGDLSWTNDKNLPNPETVNIKGGKGDPGASGVHIGTDTPPDTANVWVSPTGDPTSTEDWEFYLDDGSVDTKTVVVVGSDEETATGHLGILRVRQAGGTWKEIPALVGPKGEPGSDGYTPIKGVDYFDGVPGKDGSPGADGYTPVKGVDYFDGEKGDKGDAFVYEDFTPEQLALLKGEPGKDGYTPVKGVDYFDGEQGIPGTSVTHSWNGTTLTVTSASGTSSADLKGDRGDKGDPGDTGPAGSDASVTSANITAALGYTPANEAHEHSAENITSGILPLSRGGTGAALSTKANAIIRFSSNSAKMSSTATADGAFYATTANGSAKFGTLPIAQGGTGATTPEAVLANLGISATAEELNQLGGVTSGVQGQINTLRSDVDKKANDYSIELYNGTSGNPKPVRFASFNYSTCNSENGIAAKIGMVSGHGNGSSYAFLQDAIIKVSYTGAVSVDSFKYYGASAGTYDGAERQYGDIFWLVDETNKIVDFYCLMGQYARMYQTPWRRLTYSSGGAVTQHTSCTVYSSGEKTWANNSNIALISDIPSWAMKSTKPSYTASEVGARPNTWTPSASDIGLATETWTFTLEDGSAVTKAVYVG